MPLDLESQRWRPIDGTVGVLRMVKVGAHPRAAPAGLVEDLIAATGADGALDLVGDDLVVGQLVRVIRGPFAEHLAVVERASAGERIRVLLAIMSQSVPVDLQRVDLAAL